MWRLDVTKNITLAVDEVELNGARIYAARRSTTVNALVRKYLASLNDGDERRHAAVMRMRARAAATPLAETGGPITRGWGDHAD
jgi:hypothetical protein